MISNIKKHFPSQILQLILALSLLQSDLDPDSYFEWDLESRYSRGNVGLLERHAPPLSEYPYANRKALMPLIEDLARFDSVPSAFQTYLFTHNATFPVSSDTPTDSSNQPNQTTTIEPDQPSEEIFLNSEIFTESTSIFDQNLADLNDFGEAAAHHLNIYDSLKEEPVENTLFDLFKCERPGSSCDDPEFGSFTAPSPDDDEGGAGGVIEWDEYFGVKHEIDESLLLLKEEESDSLNEVEVHTTHDDPEVEIKPEPVTAELTPEEMDLIKILATQDIDMGFVPPETDAERVKKEREDKDTAEKLKVLLDISDDKTNKKLTDDDDNDDFGGLPFTIDLETGEKILLSSTPSVDTFDEPVFEDVSAFDQLESVQLTDLIDEASGTNSPSTRATTSSSAFDEDLSEFGIDPSDFDALLLDTSDRSTTDDSEAVLDFDDTELDMYIQSSSFPNAHSRQQNYGHGVNGLRQSSYLPHHPQSRVPLGRSISMEQRFDFPMFSFTPGMGMGMDMAPNHPAHYASPHFPYHQATTQQFGGGGSMLHQNSTLDLGLPPHQPHYPPNLGSAVASSMNLTNSESEGTSGGGGNYKMEHDIYYYPNPSTEMNHTDDFLNPMLNDEGLQHMDTFPEDMCPMINGVSASHGPGAGNGIVHGGNTLQTSLTNVGASGTGTGDRLDASSDSAVSSMGSERVPSLSDGEWNDGSDSAQEYNNPYDYSYSNRDGGRGPVAQKKHQMFGKRIFSEGQQPTSAAPEHIPATIKYEYDPYGISSSTGMEGAVGGHLTGKQPAFMQHPEIKYPPYAIDFGRPLRTPHDLVAHNHSYPLPQTQGMTPRPQTRDKKSKKSEEEHLTRDEKRARQLAIPISVQDIINLPMDEFNERLSKYDLSESQLSLIRDIRRRGKNKVAAQNCRKRKLDQINSLAEEVGEMRMRKERLLREREMALRDRSRVKEKYMALYRHVTNNLRDPDGNPCSTSNYSLQLSAEGEVHLLPRPTLENQQQQGGHQSAPVRGGTTTQGQSSSNHTQHPAVPHQPHHHGHHPHHYPHQKE